MEIRGHAIGHVLSALAQGSTPWRGVATSSTSCTQHPGAEVDRRGAGVQGHGTPRYRDIATNAWNITVGAHTYVIGGNSQAVHVFWRTPVSGEPCSGRFALCGGLPGSAMTL